MNIINYNKVLEDKILEDLYYLISLYMKDDKKIDQSFLESVLYIVNDSKKLEKYITKISIDNNMKSRGAYYNLDLDIAINVNKIIKDLKYNEEKYSPGENKLRKYIRIIESVLHEIEHGNQERIQKVDNTYESKILTYSNKTRNIILNELRESEMMTLKKYLKLYFFRLKYHRYYNCCPYERLAYIKSCQKSIELTEKFGSKKLYDYENFRMNMNYLEGYKRSLNPTAYYIKKVNPNFEDWKEIESECINLSLEDRKILGLKLSKEELLNLAKNGKKSLSKIEHLLK